jgi:hypothetical protein
MFGNELLSCCFLGFSTKLMEVPLMMREMAVIKCEFEMAGEAHPRAWSDGLVSETAVR